MQKSPARAHLAWRQALPQARSSSGRRSAGTVARCAARVRPASPASAGGVCVALAGARPVGARPAGTRVPAQAPQFIRSVRSRRRRRRSRSGLAGSRRRSGPGCTPAGRRRQAPQAPQFARSAIGSTHAPPRHRGAHDTSELSRPPASLRPDDRGRVRTARFHHRRHQKRAAAEPQNSRPPAPSSVTFHLPRCHARRLPGGVAAGRLPRSLHKPACGRTKSQAAPAGRCPSPLL